MKDTLERRQRILQFLREGHSFAVAAGNAGITRETLRQWQKADKDFANQCDAAACEGLADIEKNGVIDLAKAGDLNAAKFILERRKQTRDEYAPALHNTPLVALQANYLHLNPLAHIAPDLMNMKIDQPKLIDSKPSDGEDGK